MHYERILSGYASTQRVNGFGTSGQRCIDDPLALQIRVCRSSAAYVDGFVCHFDVLRPGVGVGVDSNSCDAHLPRCLHDPARNLTAVCHHDLVERSRIRRKASRHHLGARGQPARTCCEERHRFFAVRTRQLQARGASAWLDQMPTVAVQDKRTVGSLLPVGCSLRRAIDRGAHTSIISPWIGLP